MTDKFSGTAVKNSNRRKDTAMFIEVKNAIKKYGKGNTEVFALNDAGFSTDKGEICVILGSSGSGKSTLLNMLGGIDTLDSGSISVDGKEISGLNGNELVEYRRSDIGFVFQFYNLIPDLNARENIEAVADIADSPLDIDEIMSTLDISDFKDRYPNELSGGQQQRVAIARALVKNPKLLLCDELTGALDSSSARIVLEVVEKVNQKYNTTVVIITHNEKISQMADRIVTIKDGKVINNIKNAKKITVEEIDL